MAAVIDVKVAAGHQLVHDPRSNLHIYHGGHLDLVLKAEPMAAIVEAFLTAGNRSATPSRS